MGSDVEERQLQENREGFEYPAPRMASRILRSLPSIKRELLAEVGLRRAECSARWIGETCGGLALLRHHSRFDAVSLGAGTPSCRRRKAHLLPQRPEPSPIPHSKSLPADRSQEDFRIERPVRLRARTGSRRGRGGARRIRRRSRRGGRGVGFLRLLSGGRRIHDGCVVLSFFLSGRRRRCGSDNVGFLFARSEKRGTG